MRFLSALTLFIISAVSTAQAVTLSWDIPENERLEMVRTAKVNYYINRQLSRSFEERNIIDLTCFSKKGDASNVKGVFSVFHRENNESVFHLREQHMVDFSIAPDGRFTVPDKDYMPNLRNVPSFPENDVKVNDQWTGQGELIINSFSRAFKLIFPVEYTLSDIKKQEGSEIAIIKYRFVIDRDMRGQGLPADFPLKISGQNLGIIAWDITQKKPVEYTDMYSIMFIMRTGQASIGTQEFTMNIETKNKQYKPVSEKEKEKDKEEIEKALPKDSGIDVDTDKRGIVLRMGEVLFDFDSYNLRPDTRKTLEKVTDIIKEKYPDREIIVEGHTDDTGSWDYNQKLSNQRARSVAEFLKPGVGHDKFSYRGFGPDKPIADNKTKEGRQKNRRVEIIIKLH